MASVVARDRRRRWSLVAVLAAVLIALPAVVAALPSPVAPVEPGRLRELMVRSAAQPYQGYAESTGTVGVPDLPNLTQVTSLVNGTTRIRSWYDSPERWRFDVLSLGNEHDVYRTPEGEFLWEYGTSRVTQVLGEQPVRLPRAGDLLPPDLARRVLAAAPGDPVEALPARRVAGVGAVGLRVRPADPETTIGQVDIWAEPDSGLPLRVEVTARGGAAPILVTEFLEVRLDRPDPLTLTPAHPPEAEEHVLMAPDIVAALGVANPALFPAELAGRPLRTAELAGVPGAALYGTGLSAFVVLPLPRGLGGRATEAARKAAAIDLTLPGGTGVLLTIPPVTVIIERSTASRRSFLLTGLVTRSVLERAAADLSTAPRSGR
ncbi:hypothetical protein [Actinophytocola sp.]|uniref:hypothetical protein n=1 Tax=Actinophytocola sp. TaxID=1872138 RepID=UPI002D7FDC29|nr:hypothetical protein [Actinophytocola sp.]